MDFERQHPDDRFILRSVGSTLILVGNRPPSAAGMKWLERELVAFGSRYPGHATYLHYAFDGGEMSMPDDETRALLSARKAHPEWLELRFTQSVEESMALNRIHSGAIILAASGMCDAGRIKHHLRHNLGRPECAIVIIGFQAEGTLGRRLVDGEKRVRLFGEELRASKQALGQLVTIEAGKTTEVRAALTHSVDSGGVMCADFHIHSFYSADSSDPVEAKVKSAIADGLEIPISSEHEWIIDFQPIVQKLGMTAFAFG